MKNLARTTAAAVALLVSLVAPARLDAALLIVPDQFQTIQTALDAATTGDSVMVRAGTYAESLSLSGKNLALFSEQGAPSTTLSGGGAHRILALGAGVNATTIISGFTFTNGWSNNGGAGLNLAAGGGVILRDCHFINNRAVDGSPRGGAIRSHIGAITLIEDCEFVSNEAYYTDLSGDGAGGGIYCAEGGFLSLQRSVFIDNASSGFEGGPGGAVHTASPSVIEDSYFTKNFGFYGAGVYASDSLTVSRCEFVDNGAWEGGAIYSLTALTAESCSVFRTYAEYSIIVHGTADIANCSFVQNHEGGIAAYNASIIARHNLIADNQGYGFYSYQTPPNAVFVCNDAWANDEGNYGGDLADPTGSNGNISADPLFCINEWPPNEEHPDLSLREGSPCLPGQNNCGLIGAIGQGCEVAAVSELAPSPSRGAHLWPNPAPMGQSIRIDTGTPAARADLYTVSGRWLRRLQLDRASRSQTWHPGALPEGVYFLKVRWPDHSDTQKLVLTR